MFVKLVLIMLTQVYEKFIQLESGFPFQGRQNVGGEQKSEYRVQVVMCTSWIWLWISLAILYVVLLPPTNMALVLCHVGWICCWFSPWPKCFFFSFPLSTKNPTSPNSNSTKGPVWKPAKTDVASSLNNYHRDNLRPQTSFKVYSYTILNLSHSRSLVNVFLLFCLYFELSLSHTFCYLYFYAFSQAFSCCKSK